MLPPHTPYYLCSKQALFTAIPFTQNIISSYQENITGMPKGKNKQTKKTNQVKNFPQFEEIKQALPQTCQEKNWGNYVTHPLAAFTAVPKQRSQPVALSIYRAELVTPAGQWAVLFDLSPPANKPYWLRRLFYAPPRQGSKFPVLPNC